MGKLHRTNAGYLGVSMEETQDPFWTYNKLALPLSETQRGIQSVISSAGTPWSNLQNAFDGSISNYANGTGNNGTASTITFPSPITGVTKLEYYYAGTSTYGYNGTGIGTGPYSDSPAWVTVYNGTAITLNNLYFVSSPGDGVVNLYAIKINDAFYSLGGAGNPSAGDLSPSNHFPSHNGTAWQTAVSKFYGGATNFGGTSWMTLPDSSDFAYGTGDFTIEFWLYQYDKSYENGSNQRIFDSITSSIVMDRPEDGDRLRFDAGGGNYYSASTYPANQWYHIAIVRSGGTLTFYKNGSTDGSSTVTTNIGSPGGTVYVARYYGGNSGKLKGYLQDFKVYKGIAKYTSSFTPPARSLVQTARRYPAGMHVLS